MFDDYKNLMIKYELDVSDQITFNQRILENLRWIVKYFPIIDRFLNGISSIQFGSLLLVVFGLIMQVIVR